MTRTPSSEPPSAGITRPPNVKFETGAPARAASATHATNASVGNARHRVDSLGLRAVTWHLVGTQQASSGEPNLRRVHRSENGRRVRVRLCPISPARSLLWTEAVSLE